MSTKADEKLDERTNPEAPEVIYLKDTGNGPAYLEQHLRDPARPFVEHPKWMDDLNIPKDSNYGDCVRTIPPEICAIMMAYHNDINRTFNTDRALALKDAISSGTYNPSNPDGVILNWNIKLINGQKRLGTAVEAQCSITIRIQYGLEPEVMPFIDRVEARKRHQAIMLVSTPKINMLLGAMIPLLFKVKNGNQSRLSNEVYLKLFNEHRRGLLWITKLVAPNHSHRSYIYSVGVLLAFAEYYLRHSTPAEQFVECFYRIGDYQKVPLAIVYSTWCTGNRGEGERKGKKQTVSDQLKTYRRAISYLVAHANSAKLDLKRDSTWDDKIEADTELNPVAAMPQVDVPMYAKPIRGAIKLLRSPDGQPLLPRYDRELVLAARNASAISHIFNPPAPSPVYTAFLFLHPDALESLTEPGDFHNRASNLHTKLVSHYGGFRSPNVKQVYLTELQTLWKTVAPVRIDFSECDRLSLNAIYKGRKPVGFVFEDKTYPALDWASIYQKVCGMFHDRDPKLFSSLPDQPYAVSRLNCRYFSRVATCLRSPHIVGSGSTRLFIERNLSSDSIRKNLLNMFKTFKIEIDQLVMLVKSAKQQ